MHFSPSLPTHPSLCNREAHTLLLGPLNGLLSSKGGLSLPSPRQPSWIQERQRGRVLWGQERADCLPLGILEFSPGPPPLSPQCPTISKAQGHIHTHSMTRSNSMSPSPQLPDPWPPSPLLQFPLSTCPLPQPQSLWAAVAAVLTPIPTLATSPSVILMEGGRGLLDSLWDRAGLGKLPGETGRSLELEKRGKGGSRKVP